MAAPKCSGCGRLLTNKDGDLQCTDARCLQSVHLRGVECPTCYGPPAEITDAGTGYINFVCEQGHRSCYRPMRGVQSA